MRKVEPPREFLPLIDFLLEKNYELLDSPIDGNFLRMFILLETKNLQFTCFKEFTHQVVKLNSLFPGAISVYGLHDAVPTLLWFNYAYLLQLKDRLLGKPYQVVPFHEPTKSLPTKYDAAALIDILNAPLHTQVQVTYSSDPIINNIFHTDYTELKSILDQQTAKRILDRERSKVVTEPKHFLEVCKDTNHGRSLANFCLNSREYPHGITDSLSTNHLHKVLDNYKKLISQDINTCLQSKIHFLPILNNHTEPNLGDCSYLDACHKMKTCRYVHYFSFYPKGFNSKKKVDKISTNEYNFNESFTEPNRKVLPPQWINCDVRYIPFPILGKFAAIVSDPAWDIHMSLPYGTCKDIELLSLPIHELQDEGIIMLWVTGRSIEVGRQALVKWGYEVSDEMIWIKLNQLKRTIVTGRTGHWLNHSKEHLLVGVKGNPIWLTSKVDLDIVVSNTRETSRKPDEIYDIVERMVGKHARKLEMFGRDHNTRPGWLTIGNQLKGTSIVEEDLKLKYEAYTASDSFKGL